jgi:hypothetical protein
MDKHGLSYVSLIFEKDIKIKCYDKTTKQLLRKLGATRELFCWNHFHLAHENELELAEKLMKLRDCGIFFAGGSSGWPPASVVSYLMEKKFFKGEYQEICWTNPRCVLLYNVKSSGERILNQKIELKPRNIPF